MLSEVDFPFPIAVVDEARIYALEKRLPFIVGMSRHCFVDEDVPGMQND